MNVEKEDKRKEKMTETTEKKPRKKTIKLVKKSKEKLPDDKPEDKQTKIGKVFDPWSVLQFPHLAEKSMRMVEGENKLVFIVNKNSSKNSVKKAVEELYNVKVEKVNLLLDTKARKKAFVKISKEFNASELATRLGVL